MRAYRSFPSSFVLVCALVLPLALPSVSLGDTPLTTTLFASGLEQPLYVTAPPGDTTRVFIVEQTGRIKIVENGQLLPQPFHIQTGLSTGSVAGLLGMAFHPEYETNGYFYVHYTSSNGGARIDRYTVSANPNVADSLSAFSIIVFPVPQFAHVGGWIAFGPTDGYLYVAKGDAESNPEVAQSDSTRNGKILRLDVDGGSPYAIPASNPFAGDPSPKNEFWAKGLRNSWRCSHDRSTGDLYVADVGAFTFEEINFEPDSISGGRNYGWPRFEGWSIYDCPDPCDSSGFTRPIHIYPHQGTPWRCAVTGGYVYRGPAIPDLQGSYFFADFCSKQIWSMRVVNGLATAGADRTAELAPGGGLDIKGISSFGEDALGELYICDLVDGEVFKIVADPTSVAGPDLAGPLLAPYPNPSRHGFTIRTNLDASATARLAVFSADGRRVRSALEPSADAGKLMTTWDSRDAAGKRVPSGVYFVRLEHDRSVWTRPLTVIR